MALEEPDTHTGDDALGMESIFLGTVALNGKPNREREREREKERRKERKVTMILSGSWPGVLTAPNDA